ncbi:oligosaccharide flippase family protein [Haloarcula amylovorans]|uniref:oligosaccharide flippase family protein n=1 Tax=Haloarcula amylovorans TaxID=2562280 RepID=UPI00107622F7|nr:polysaccharide biosynthesis C-terminal domain-containing protein [Halomicroarcula amylolytica]
MAENDRRIARGFLSILSGEVGALLLGLLITPVVVRLLGSGGYGAYSVVLSLLGILVVVSNAGISDGVRKFIAEKRSEKWPASVFGFYTRLSLATAFVVAGSLVLAVEVGVVAKTLGTQFEPYIYLLALLLVGRQLFLTARSTLMGLGLEHYSEPLFVVQKALFGVVGVALAASGLGVAGVLAGHIAATFTVATVAFLLVARELDVAALWRRAAEPVPRNELLSFNVLSVVLTLLMTSLYHVDILLLQPFSGNQATGYYRAALLIAEFVWFVPFALQMVLLQSTAELWADDKHEAISRVASRATRYTAALALLVALGIAGLVDAFVPLYFGREFAVASDAILLLLPGAFGFAVARPIFAIGQGKGDLRILVVATAVAAALNICLNLLLIPRYGMYGAAAATSVSYGSMLLLHVLSARRVGFDPLGDLRAGGIAAAGLLTAPVVFGLPILLGDGILALVVVPPLGGLVYGVTALRTGVVTGEELRPVIDRLPAPVSAYLDWSVQAIET